MNSSEHSSPSESNGRVLVVDDTDSVRQLLRFELETAGFEVHEAATQLELQRRLTLGRPDALLLDLQRPAIDGLDLLRRLRARQTLQDVPIVFLAGSVDDAFRLDALRGGADWFAVRPLGVAQLRIQLANLIRNGRRTRRLADDDVGQLAWHDDNPLYRAGGQVRLNAG
jgi:two-component system, OmpR family, alkaline phosphatase synthesis response regulator PhoP